LAAVISVATIISYLTGPVSAMTLRRTAAELRRPLHMPGLPVLAWLAFVFSTALLYWAEWPLTGEIILLIIVALPVDVYFKTLADDFFAGTERLLISLALVVPTLFLAVCAISAYIFLTDSSQLARPLGFAALAFVWTMLCIVVPCLRLQRDAGFWPKMQS